MFLPQWRFNLVGIANKGTNTMVSNFKEILTFIKYDSGINIRSYLKTLVVNNKSFTVCKGRLRGEGNMNTTYRYKTRDMSHASLYTHRVTLNLRNCSIRSEPASEAYILLHYKQINTITVIFFSEIVIIRLYILVFIFN